MPRNASPEPTPPELRDQRDVRGGPQRVSWALDNLPTADAHRVDIRFDATIRARAEAADRRLFGEAFPFAAVVNGEVVASKFAGSMRDAAARRAASKVVAALLEDRDGWITVLRAAGDAAAFAVGLELIGPFELTLDSPTFRDAQRQHVRAAQVGRAGELLREWEAARAATPNVPPGRLLSAVSADDRGATLAASLAADAPPATLWVAAGPTLLRLDRDSDTNEPRLSRVPVPTVIGPLRSVRLSGDRLLLGGRGGVLDFDPADPSSAVAYRDPQLSSDHGFTAASRSGASLWAIHRDGGLLRWDEPGDAPVALRPADLGGFPIGLVAAGTDRVAFAVGNEVLTAGAGVAPAVVAGMGAAVIALLPMTADVFVAFDAAGSAVAMSSHALQQSVIRAVSPAVAGALLPWSGQFRALVSVVDGPIRCIGWDDDTVTQYVGGPPGARILAAAPGVVAAVSPDRQRVLIWNAWDGRAPVSQTFVTSLTRNRIADLIVG